MATAGLAISDLIERVYTIKPYYVKTIVERGWAQYY